MRVFSRISLKFPSTPHLAKPMLYAVLFMRCVFFLLGVFVNMQERWGKFILFLARAKRGKGNALFVFCRHKALGKNKMCIFLCGGLFFLFYLEFRKNVNFGQKNIVYKRKNINSKHSNIIYRCENMNYKHENIIFRRANIFYKRKNIKKS